MDKAFVLQRLKEAGEATLAQSPLAKMADGSLPGNGMATLMRQYELLSLEFPKILCLYGARLSTDTARLGIVSNLWDEHGRGIVGHGHRELLRRFLDAFLPTRNDSISGSWQTRMVLNGFNGIVDHGTTSEALGALLFCEGVTPAEYSRVVIWMRKNTALTDRELEFWLDHIEHDGDHAKALLDDISDAERVLLPEVVEGIQQAASLEQLFWNQWITEDSR